MSQARGVLGIVLLIGLAWLLSSDRRKFPLKTVLGGLALQWLLGLLVLKTDPGRAFFDAIATIVTVILRGADEGAKFVFGPLAGDHAAVAWKAVAGIKIMTTILVVATLSSIGYHYGVLQHLVRVMASAMTRLLGVSGAEGLAGAGNVFLGQTESPLLVRPYIDRMTRSEIMAMMTGGFATISAGVMAYYVSVLGVNAAGEPDPARAVEIARHLMTASLMSAPAAFVMAKIIIPETQKPATGRVAQVSMNRDTSNLLDAASTGASEGMRLAINVLAMLIAFIALIAIVDTVLVWIGNWAWVSPMVQKLGMKQLDLNGILGLLFAPIAFLNGVEQAECRAFGGLLGKAMATNEMIAYGSLGELIREQGLSNRSILIATYSLCGFANFSSIGIQIGGIGSLAPSRREDLVRLGPRAMLAGAMACWMTGCIAGVLIP